MPNEPAVQPKASAALGTPTSHYVLVDHENVQPTDFGLLDRGDVRVLVFVGAKQGKVSSDMAIHMQGLGARARYVRVSAVGKNALDFHIAFHVGQIAGTDPQGFFHIISKDKGYDPLLAHLKEAGIQGARSESIAAMPLFKPKAKKSTGRRLQVIVDPPSPPARATAVKVAPNPPSQKTVTAKADARSLTGAEWVTFRTALKKMGDKRPVKLAALKNHVVSFVEQRGLHPEVVDGLIGRLKSNQMLRVLPDGKLTWYADKL